LSTRQWTRKNRLKPVNQKDLEGRRGLKEVEALDLEPEVRSDEL
jgi:hypothetical protein